MNPSRRIIARALLASMGTLGLISSAIAQQSILNASYDVSREIYKGINPAFVAYWQARC